MNKIYKKGKISIRTFTSRQPKCLLCQKSRQLNFVIIKAYFNSNNCKVFKYNHSCTILFTLQRTFSVPRRNYRCTDGPPV